MDMGRIEIRIIMSIVPKVIVKFHEAKQHEITTSETNPSFHSCQCYHNLLYIYKHVYSVAHCPHD